jgi:ribosomal protein L19E
MKPLHSTIKRLSRCPCCQSKHSPHNSGKGKRGGKSAARQETKRQMVRVLSE